jgi:hypothetical protein
MPSVFFDVTHSDVERRRRLYAGDVYVYSARPSTAALCDFARELIAEAFDPLDPLEAQHSLPVERFVEIVAPLKPRFIHHPRTKDLVRAVLLALGCDLGATYFDVPRMRVSTSDDYLSAGVAYVLHPHRDVWYAAPLCQLNWWLPVYPFAAESSFAFHPRYWDEAVPNTSGEYNHYEWNLNGRKNAALQVGADTRKQPRPTAPLELEPSFRIVCPPGGLILFSGAHLHSTVPNTSGRSRFSIDFRTAHRDDLAVKGGAPNLDTAPIGTTLHELRRADDLSPVPPEVITLYDPNPPRDGQGLVFQPPMEEEPLRIAV